MLTKWEIVFKDFLFLMLFGHPATTTSVYGTTSIIGAGKIDLGNAPTGGPSLIVLARSEEDSKIGQYGCFRRKFFCIDKMFCHPSFCIKKGQNLTNYSLYTLAKFIEIIQSLIK